MNSKLSQKQQYNGGKLGNPENQTNVLNFLRNYANDPQNIYQMKHDTKIVKIMIGTGNVSIIKVWWIDILKKSFNDD